MKVSLLSYQQDALDILLYTKNTRLKGLMSLDELRAQSEDWKLEQLSYMRDTIKSSWEFAQYIFEIEGVTRAFTHQLVRTRTASYAQEAQRVVDVSEHPFLIPPYADSEQRVVFADTIHQSLEGYTALLKMGMPRQDARGVIPTNITTSIIMAANLRTLSHMAEVRLCFKTQGEYQDVFREMRARVLEVHPWAADFILVHCAAHGTCCFPRFTDCPVQPLTIHPSQEQLAAIREKHLRTRYEANPQSAAGDAQAHYTPEK